MLERVQKLVAITVCVGKHNGDVTCRDDMTRDDKG